MESPADARVRRHRGFHCPAERPYREDERGRTTVLIGGLTWRHHEIARAVLESLGHRCEILPSPDVEAFHVGKDNCNNGLCNPIYFMVGSLLQFLRRKEAEGLSAEEITSRFVHFTVGSCGPCRHGMYEAEYRFALKNAGFEGFRIPLLVQSKGVYGQHEHPGLPYTQDLAIRGITALMLGDLLEDLEYQVRPYEVNAGDTDRVIHACVERLASVLRSQSSVEILEAAPRWLAALLSGHGGLRDAVRGLAKFRGTFRAEPFRAGLRECRERIGAIEVDRLRVKPVVKIIGEFYSQTTESFGNYGMFAFLEREGAEVVPPTVMAWVTYLLYQAGDHWRSRKGLTAPHRDARPWQLPKRLVNAVYHARWASLFWLGEHLCGRVYRRLARDLGGIAHDLLPQAELARLARPFYNTLLKGGEGHQEIGKNIHCSANKHAHMVLSLKPFGCMPSQLSDGVQSAVIGRYPGTVFLPVETSGEGEVHVQSRVQMALSEARARAREEFDAALASTRRPLADIRAYVASHPTLRRAGYRVPRCPGIAGRAAALVLHVSRLMDGGGRAS